MYIQSRKEAYLQKASELYIMFCMPKAILQNGECHIEYIWTDIEAKENYETLLALYQLELSLENSGKYFRFMGGNILPIKHQTTT